MSRLFASQGFYELWKCSHFVASRVAKGQVASFLPVRSAVHHRLNTPARYINTGISVWRDTHQPKGDELEEKLDLDKWKSVMRAQSATEEKVNEKEASGDAENIGQGDELNSSRSHEAIRDQVAVWRDAGVLVPQEMTDAEVQALAVLTTKSARKKYLKYLAIREGHKKTRKEKQNHKKAQKEALMEQLGGDGEEKRSELKNKLFLSFWDRSLDKVLAWRTAQALTFGQPLVFDMSYESNMGRREMENTVTQLLQVEAWNRRDADPYHLHYCNLKADGAYQKYLLKRYGAETWDQLHITTTDKQHVDVFPREQLVYLTADSPNVLHTYDHSKVYIIGAFVDKYIQTGTSLANAKRLKLATARLPLDKYYRWGHGGKNLTLDQMIRIMLTVKETGNWEEALKFVPQRKVAGSQQQRDQEETTYIRRGANNGPRWHRDQRVRAGDRHYERTLKNEGQSLNRSYEGFDFSGRERGTGNRETKRTTTKVRSSFKNNVEGRRGAGKMWWDEE